MADSEWPGDDSVVTKVMALPTAERHVLAAVAVVGRASLSESELADLVEIDDVQPLVADLERRGLIKGDERKRYSLLGRVGEEIRKTDDALATGDQLMQYISTLARAGTLTPARLADDAQAILGLSEWAAEHQQWTSLLEFVKTLQSCFAIANRIEEWLALLERGRGAARMLGDRQSEVWALQQMATAETRAGNVSAAHEYLRAADELQRGGTPTVLRVEQADEALADGGRVVVGGGGPRWVLWVVGLVVAGAAGAGAAVLITDGNGNQGQATRTVQATKTVTTTVQGSGTPTTLTVTTTTTELTTTTETTTVFTDTTTQLK